MFDDLMKENKILFMIQYGSYNYNLVDIGSDMDWRGFSNRLSEKSVENLGINNYDICINGTKYLYKAITEMIPKYVELLFSDTIIISENISSETKILINELFILKNSIAVMDLKQMYNSYLSEYNMHQNWIIKNKNPSKNIDYMIHSFRILNILIRFLETEFGDYKYAICYSNEDIERKLILDFKNNNIKIEEFENILNNKFARVKKIKDKFNKKVNLNLIKQLREIIEEISKRDVI